MLANVIIVAIVAVLVVFGVRRIVGTATGKRDCCSGDARQTGRSFRPVTIEDTDESHYPYLADLTISGMHCDNCARNVTNALDSVEGTWARVDLGTRTAHVLSKGPIDQAAYRDVVGQAGYRVIGVAE